MKLEQTFSGARIVEPTSAMNRSAEKIGTKTQKARRQATKSPSLVSKPSRDEYLSLVAAAYARAVLRFAEQPPTDDGETMQERTGDVIKAELEGAIEYGNDRQRKSRDKRAIVYLWSKEILPEDVAQLGREPGHGLDAWAKAGSAHKPFTKLEFGSANPAPSENPYIVEIRRQVGFEKETWIIGHEPWGQQLMQELADRAKQHPKLAMLKPANPHPSNSGTAKFSARPSHRG